MSRFRSYAPRRVTGWFAAWFLAASLLAAAPGEWTSVEFHAVVAGTSTLHDWSVETRQAAGGFVVDESARTVTAGRLVIPAKSLAGSSGGLNERMYKALRADAHPDIVFELTSFEGVVPVLPLASEPEAWTVRGVLQVSGGRREIVLTPRVAPAGDGRLELTAETRLKMTDFGVKPPTFMGMVRTGNEVTVTLRWVVQASAPAPVAMRQ